MRSSRRQSLIVNFFTFSLYRNAFNHYGLYSKFIANDEPEKPKNPKLSHYLVKDIFSTSKVYNPKLLNDSLKALDKRFYKLDGLMLNLFILILLLKFISLGEIDGFIKSY